MDSADELKWMKMIKEERVRRAAGNTLDDDFDKLFNKKKKKRAKFESKGFMAATTASKLAVEKVKAPTGPVT